MIGPIPEGPAWGVAVLLAMLLKDAIRALVQRRNGSSNGKVVERLSRLENGKVAERLTRLETQVAGLIPADATAVATRLAVLEVTIGSNTQEIGRFRDWKHDDIGPLIQRIETRVANLELDMRDRGREP